MNDIPEEIPLFDEYGNQVARPEDTNVEEVEEIDKAHLLKMATEKMMRFTDLEKKRKQTESDLAVMMSELATLNEELLQIMKLIGMQKFTMNGRTIGIRKDLYASALANTGDSSPEDAKLRLHKALRDTGHGDLVKEGVNASALAAMVREYDPDKTRDEETIYANMPEELRGTIKISIVEKVTSRKS